MNSIFNSVMMALMPAAGDAQSILPFILVGLAAILVVTIIIVTSKKNKDDKDDK